MYIYIYIYTVFFYHQHYIIVYYNHSVARRLRGRGGLAARTGGPGNVQSPNRNLPVQATPQEVRLEVS